MKQYGVWELSEEILEINIKTDWNVKYDRSAENYGDKKHFLIGWGELSVKKIFRKRPS